MAKTKVQVEKDFKEIYAEVLKGMDKPAKALAWHTYTDELCKSGEITQKQYDTWDNPSFIK